MKFRVPKKVLALTLCTILGMGSAFSAVADESRQHSGWQEGSVSGNDSITSEETVSGNSASVSSVSGSDLVYQDEDVTIHVSTPEKLGDDVRLSARKIVDGEQGILMSLLEQEDVYDKTLYRYEPYHLELEGENAPVTGEFHVSVAMNGHETDDYTKLFGWSGIEHVELESEVTPEGASVNTDSLGDYVAAAYIDPVYVEQEWEKGVNYTDAAPLVEEEETVDFPRMFRRAMFAADQSIASIIAMGEMASGLMGNNYDASEYPMFRSAAGESDGLIINKKAEKNGDNYKLTLDAYITGKVSTSVEHVPADIVLVLDVSGSMNWAFGNSTTYVKVYTPVMGNTYFHLLYYQGKPLYVETTYNNGWCYNAPDGSGLVYITTGTPTLPAGMALYSSKTSNLNRMEALKSAAGDFINLVEADAQYNKVNHRIGVTTFSSGWSTGVYVGSQFYSRGSAAKAQYGNVLRNTITTESGGDSQINDVRDSINALRPGGGTYTRTGMEMAEGVITNTSLLPNEKKRNRIVILFTDGETNDSNYQKTDGIQYARTIKHDYSGTVYCVSVLPGANPDGDTENDRYMKYLSSLYPEAQSWENPGIEVPPATGSYYLTANDTAGLAGVFENIFNQLSTPDIELGPEAVMKDILSLEFELPAGKSSVKAYTAECTGKAGNTYTFGEKVPFPDAKVTISGKNVDVSNFDYGKNFVAVYNGKPQGKKLILEIDVKANDNFIGGGEVQTNNPDSGIYDKNGGKLKSFPTPKSEVPTKFIFEVSNGSIYIKDQKDAQETLFSLIDGDHSKDGLQYRTSEGGTSYTLGEDVNGTVGNSQMTVAYEVRQGEKLVGTYTVQAGQKTGKWSNVNFDTKTLKADTKLAVTAVLTPVAGGSPKQIQPSKAQPTLYVFRPEIPVTDTTIFLGETTDITKCVKTAEITWKCDALGSEATKAKELLPQTAPTLEFDYTRTAGSKPDGTLTQFTSFTPKVSSNFKLVVKKKGEDITPNSTLKPNETPEDSRHEIYDLANYLKPHDFTIHVVGGSIVIFKELPDGSYNDKEGDPIFTFKIEYIGEKGEKETFYRVIRYSVDSGRTMSAYDLKNLPKGSYKITELQTIRYEIKKITQDVPETNCPVVLDGINSITFEIGKTVKATDGWARFVNTKTGDSPRLTDTDVRVNFFSVVNGHPNAQEDSLVHNGGMMQ